MGYDSLLTGNLLHIAHGILQHLLIADRFTNTHIKGDFGYLRHLHDAAELKLAHQILDHSLFIVLL
jgi:hypothetical protein